MTPDRPAASWAAIQASTLASQGARSASSSGRPDFILATLAGEWNSSPSWNVQPRRRASASPTVVLPLPETPITTRTVAGGVTRAASCGYGRGVRRRLVLAAVGGDGPRGDRPRVALQHLPDGLAVALAQEADVEAAPPDPQVPKAEVRHPLGQRRIEIELPGR